MDEKKLAKMPKPARPPKVVSEFLTAEEIADLRREAKETTAYARKAFAHLRPKRD
jgi:hypothetical protein